MLRVWFVVCVVVFLGLGQMDCSDGNLTNPEEIGAIGSAGGFLRADVGASLKIPSFALDHAVLFELKVTPVSSPPAGWVALSQAVAILPEKIRFGSQQYALLSLPLELSRLPSQRNVLDLFVAQQVDNQWKPYALYALQESTGSMLVWVQETGTFAVFLKPLP